METWRMLPDLLSVGMTYMPRVKILRHWHEGCYLTCCLSEWLTCPGPRYWGTDSDMKDVTWLVVCWNDLHAQGQDIEALTWRMLPDLLSIGMTYMPRAKILRHWQWHEGCYLTCCLSEWLACPGPRYWGTDMKDVTWLAVCRNDLHAQGQDIEALTWRMLPDLLSVGMTCMPRAKILRHWHEGCYLTCCLSEWLTCPGPRYWGTDMKDVTWLAVCRNDLHAQGQDIEALTVTWRMSPDLLSVRMTYMPRAKILRHWHEGCYLTCCLSEWLNMPRAKILRHWHEGCYLTCCLSEWLNMPRAKILRHWHEGCYLTCCLSEWLACPGPRYWGTDMKDVTWLAVCRNDLHAQGQDIEALTWRMLPDMLSVGMTCMPRAKILRHWHEGCHLTCCLSEWLTCPGPRYWGTDMKDVTWLAVCRNDLHALGQDIEALTWRMLPDLLSVGMTCMPRAKILRHWHEGCYLTCCLSEWLACPGPRYWGTDMKDVTWLAVCRNDLHAQGQDIEALTWRMLPDLLSVGMTYMPRPKILRHWHEGCYLTCCLSEWLACPGPRYWGTDMKDVTWLAVCRNDLHAQGQDIEALTWRMLPDWLSVGMTAQAQDIEALTWRMLPDLLSVGMTCMPRAKILRHWHEGCYLTCCLSEWLTCLGPRYWGTDMKDVTWLAVCRNDLHAQGQDIEALTWRMLPDLLSVGMTCMPRAEILRHWHEGCYLTCCLSEWLTCPGPRYWGTDMKDVTWLAVCRNDCPGPRYWGTDMKDVTWLVVCRNDLHAQGQDIEALTWRMLPDLLSVGMTYMPRAKILRHWYEGCYLTCCLSEWLACPGPRYWGTDMKDVTWLAVCRNDLHAQGQDIEALTWRMLPDLLSVGMTYMPRAKILRHWHEGCYLTCCLSEWLVCPGPRYWGTDMKDVTWLAVCRNDLHAQGQDIEALTWRMLPDLLSVGMTCMPRAKILRHWHEGCYLTCCLSEWLACPGPRYWGTDMKDVTWLAVCRNDLHAQGQDIEALTWRMLPDLLSVGMTCMPRPKILRHWHEGCYLTCCLSEWLACPGPRYWGTDMKDVTWLAVCRNDLHAQGQDIEALTWRMLPDLLSVGMTCMPRAKILRHWHKGCYLTCCLSEWLACPGPRYWGTDMKDVTWLAVCRNDLHAQAQDIASIRDVERLSCTCPKSYLLPTRGTEIVVRVSSELSNSWIKLI